MKINADANANVITLYQVELMIVVYTTDQQS